MKAKRLLNIMLVMLLVLSVLAGCGSNADTPTNVATSGTSAPAGETTSKPAETEQEEPYKLSIAMSHGNRPYIMNQNDPNKDKYVLELAKKTNTIIDLRLLDHGNLDQDINLMFASGDMPDVLFDYNLTRASVDAAVKIGAFMELTELLDKYAPNIKKAVSQEAWEMMDILHKNEIYAIPSFPYSKAARAVFLRKDLLDKYSLKIPETVDEYIDVLRVFKNNGVKYPYNGRENLIYTTAFLHAFGGEENGAYIFDGGKLMPSAIIPGMKEGLKVMRQLYEEGILDKEFLTNKGSDWTNRIYSGESGMWEYAISMYATVEANLKANVPEAEIVLCAGPKGPEGYHGAGTEQGPAGSCVLISSKAKDPARVVKFLDWMMSDEGLEFYAFGIEGDTYKKNNGKIEFTYPTTPEGIEELTWRSSNFKLVKGTVVDPLLIDYQPGGAKIKEYVDKYGDNDYVPSVFLLGGEPEGFKLRPELKSNTSPTSLWLTYASKIIYGVEPVDAFEKFVDEWTKAGGDKILEELDAKKNAGLYISPTSKP